MIWFRRILRVLGGLALFLIVAIFIFIHSVRLYPTTKKLEKQFTKNGYSEPYLDTVHTQYGTLTYIDNKNTEAENTVVFIHGSPGSSQDFRLFFQDSIFSGKNRLISINRLGYGKVDYGKNVEDLVKQGEAIVQLLKILPEDRQVVWVGHSYGGAPAAVCAALVPERTQALLLAAAPMDPDQEKKFWFNNLFHSKPVRFLMPAIINMASDEKMSHSHELKKAEALWGKITAPVTVLQGNKDFLSPMGNLDYAKKVFTNSANLKTIEIEGQDHFFPFTGKSEIIHHLSKMPSTNSNFSLYAFYEMGSKYATEHNEEEVQTWLLKKENNLRNKQTQGSSLLNLKGGGPFGAEWNPSNDIHFIYVQNAEESQEEYRIFINNKRYIPKASLTTNPSAKKPVVDFEIPKEEWGDYLVDTEMDDWKILDPEMTDEFYKTLTAPPEVQKFEIKIEQGKQTLTKHFFAAFGE